MESSTFVSWPFLARRASFPFLSLFLTFFSHNVAHSSRSGTRRISSTSSPSSTISLSSSFGSRRQDFSLILLARSSPNLLSPSSRQVPGYVSSGLFTSQDAPPLTLFSFFSLRLGSTGEPSSRRRMGRSPPSLEPFVYTSISLLTSLST